MLQTIVDLVHSARTEVRERMGDQRRLMCNHLMLSCQTGSRGVASMDADDSLSNIHCSRFAEAPAKAKNSVGVTIPIAADKDALDVSHFSCIRQ